MSRAKLIYALADLVREFRLSIEEKNKKIERLEKQAKESGKS